jgi:putative hydrolase of the HAD superfamily
VSDPTHILFDFFGTLVRFGHVAEYPRTLSHLANLGLSYQPQEMLDRWDAAWLPFEERCRVDHREFSMVDVATAFLTTELGRTPSPSEVDELIAVYIMEWDSSVRYLDGIRDWIRELSRRYRLAIVSNTHEPDLVPSHLRAMGIEDHFDAVVLSVELGWRKPHPEIYATALKRLGIEAGRALFIGDTYLADYVGPQQAGMTAYLIDPEARADVPLEHRLATLFDLAGRL